MTRSDYIARVLSAYERVTGSRPTDADRCVASTLYTEGEPLAKIGKAMLLVAARRHPRYRLPGQPPYRPIGCLSYFLRALDDPDLTSPDAEPGYWRYLRDRVFGDTVAA